MINKKTLYKVSRKTHKWLGLIIGLQVLLWIAGGLVMSALPIEKVRGQHLRKTIEADSVSVDEYHVDVNSVLRRHDLSPTTVEFNRLRNQPVYEVKQADEVLVFSGLNGELMPPMTVDELRRLALLYHANDVDILSIKRFEQAPSEASRLAGTVWQIVFDDWLSSTFYLHPVTGKLLLVRSDVWRLFDFVWMLHIMDYDARTNFNNPLLIIFAASGLGFAISGLILLAQVLPRRRLRRNLKA